MSVTHPAAVRTAMADWLVDQLDLGSPPGKLVFRLAAFGTAVATLTLSNPAFGNADGSGIATASAITSDTNATGNASAVATATLETGAGTVKVQCSVAASASDINMSGGLTVAAGDTVSCSALTYQSAP